jgi:hypothetical protein
MFEQPAFRSGPDMVVGVWKKENKPVYQCRKTGLLYYFTDRPKRYVPVNDVHLSGPDSESDHVDAQDEQDDVEAYSKLIVKKKAKQPKNK